VSAPELALRADGWAGVLLTVGLLTTAHAEKAFIPLPHVTVVVLPPRWGARIVAILAAVRNSARKCSGNTTLKPLEKNLLGKVDSNENHFAFLGFAWCPFGPQIAAHQLVYPLKNDLAVTSLQVENAFVAQHFGAINLNDGTEEILELRR
jgi:hypothetical protein